MKVRTSGLRGFALMALSALVFTACDDKTTIAPTPPAEVAVTVAPASVTLEVGGSQDFVAIVSNATDNSVTWTSSNAAVATVDGNGRATAVAPGTALIRATSNQDNTKFNVGAVTVNPATGPNVQVQLVPPAASVVVGQDVQLVAIVTGTTNTAVTFASTAPGVATVDASGLVTGVAPGTAGITATSVANPNEVAAATITVLAAAPPPSISIASVTPVGANNVVSGQIMATINVSADVSHDVRSVHILLRGTEVCTQTFAQPLGTTQGVATITCTIDTDALDENGVPLFVNGTAELTAEARNGAGETVAEASFGNLNIQNANVINLTIETDGAEAIGLNGLTWNEGGVVVTARPAIFTTGTVTNINICLDIPGATAAPGSATGTPCRLVAAGTNNEFVATFPKATAVASNGVAGVSNSDVRAFVTSSLLGGQPGPNAPLVIPPAAGTPSPLIRLDNVAPTADASFAPLTAFNNYVRAGFMFTSSTGAGTGTQIVTNAVDDGAPATAANIVSVEFFVVPTSTVAGLGATAAAQNAAIVANNAPITSAADLASNVSPTFYTMVVRIRDVLGNQLLVRPTATLAGALDGQMGVDLEAPTIATEPPTVGNNLINPAITTITVLSTDNFAGTAFARARITGHSVLEVNANTAVEIRCYDNAGTATAVPASGICPTFDVALVAHGTQPATGTATVNVPADENFYEIEIVTADRAGNVSSTTITRNTLVDGTAPVGTITSTTVAGSSVTMTADLMDNVDLAAYDLRFTYVGLGGLPDEVPFTEQTVVGQFGLPLTGSVTATGSNAVTVRSINGIDVSRFGFGAVDVAGNFGMVDQAFTTTTGAAIPWTTELALCTTAGNAATGCTPVTILDRSDATVVTLRAWVEVGPTDPNPVNRMYFYYVHPDGYLVLIGSVAGTAASVQTGVTERVFTMSTTLAAAGLPQAITNGTMIDIVAIAVNAAGDAITTNIETVTVND